MRKTGGRKGQALRLLAVAVLGTALCAGAPGALAAEGQTVNGGTATRWVIPVGHTVGIKLFSDGVLVVGFSGVPAAEGSVTPAKSCGLREGDVITHINSTEVDTVEEVQEQLREIGGEEMSIRAVRDGKTVQVTARAAKCSTDGSYKLGAWLRDSMAGIGTVTYYDPQGGTFGALGHGVNDTDTAQLMPMESGGVLAATVSEVQKGKRGEPGALHGAFVTEADIGTLTANTARGIFGTLEDDSMAVLEPVAVAERGDLREGEAVIYSNVAGDEVRAYTVEITKLFPNAEDGRDMMLKVTDKALLEQTGGIVQGMSGSPILQNGKLVGAVTHVLVNAPTAGYGIFIGNMMAAGEA